MLSPWRSRVRLWHVVIEASNPTFIGSQTISVQEAGVGLASLILLVHIP